MYLPAVVVTNMTWYVGLVVVVMAGLAWALFRKSADVQEVIPEESCASLSGAGCEQSGVAEQSPDAVVTQQETQTVDKQPPTREPIAYREDGKYLIEHVLYDRHPYPYHVYFLETIFIPGSTRFCCATRAEAEEFCRRHAESVKQRQEWSRQWCGAALTAVPAVEKPAKRKVTGK